jgi:hypothetical protein
MLKILNVVFYVKYLAFAGCLTYSINAVTFILAADTEKYVTVIMTHVRCPI